MRTREIGLMNHWMKEYRPNVGKCIHKTNEGRNKKKNGESRDEAKKLWRRHFYSIGRFKKPFRKLDILFY